jgi:hypothetical protein
MGMAFRRRGKEQHFIIARRNFGTATRVIVVPPKAGNGMRGAMCCGRGRTASWALRYTQRA